MPPTTVHLNGGVNLRDAETVMREILTRVPAGLRSLPDGETGDRQQWIFFQLQKFWQTPGIEDAGTGDQPAEGYDAMPKVRLAEGVDPAVVNWPNLGYAEAYQESYATFQRLRKEGLVPEGLRFQVQYPTPLASINAWFVPEDQNRVEASYERALFTDLDRLLEALPHDEIAVQWDVAVEFAILAGGFVTAPGQEFGEIIARLARCVDRVPSDVPVGLHLCYGDYQHRHFAEPESLALQVRMANSVDAAAGRQVSWYAFTVPQYQRDPAYFAPLRELRRREGTELFFALVPYHPGEQEPGTTEEQVRLVDEYLADGEWGICTECGMARAEPEEIPALLDRHREILAAYAS
ncbi:hypothetical protein [Pseudonocardia asaccharolytica]|uniref:Methionine synthase n=1 Tax=Pseudonocardia asaccharolytica DSM 44247 = NBRC 16224 TaxID=1123024 RepID=A0A511D670_9PSEU|nr:hypothetical protein [Pseudonocardia asaccharolytica]GEL20157.1 hypothetical protein PA7_39940 [Pseudonocardia asaccharolytica DSM 44247 = NBRC 16224]